MTARLGTAVSSVIATGTVFLGSRFQTPPRWPADLNLGQALLLVGHLNNEVWLMTLGMFVFGLGQSPLAGLSLDSIPLCSIIEALHLVAQETIIVRFFKSHGLGISLGPYHSTLLEACSVSMRGFQLLGSWLAKAPLSFRRAHHTLCHSGPRTLRFTSLPPPRASRLP